MDGHQERDEWLMAQVGLGRRECLEPLIRRYATPLLTFLTRLVGNMHLGEELFQEVFLLVWQRRKTYRFPMPFRPWLYQIAVNCGRGAFRGRRPLANFEPELAQLQAAQVRSPDEAAIDSETAGLVLAAVARLPARQREVVVLRMWNGLSYAEIAEALRINEVTARSNMHQGLVSLRRILQPRLAPSGS